MRRLQSLIIAVLVGTAPMASATWSITDLGTFGGTNTSIATDINNLGQVVGAAAAPPVLLADIDLFYPAHAFISAPNGGALTDLGHLGGFVSTATAVNDAGRVVGTSAEPGFAWDSPFITGPNGSGGLGGFVVPADGGPPFGSPTGVNNLGQVTGVNHSIAYVTGPNATGYTIISEGDTQPFGVPVAINDRGQVAMSGGYLWTQAGGIQTVGAGVGFTTDINAAGQIVGTTLSGAGFISGPDGGALQLIGTLGGTSTNPVGLNDLGQIVGKSQTADGQMHAFVTALDGTMIDLETLPEIGAAGWSNLVLADINNLGQIAGTGMIDGNQRAFFLAPPIPEPESWALLLGGLALLGVLRRRQAEGNA